MQPPEPAKIPTRSRIRWWSLRAFGTLCVLLVLALVAGALYQAISVSHDRARLSPPGEMVDIGGHRLHLYCTGSGSPTILLEAGAQFWSASWQWIQEDLSRTTRVCSYDRSGLGWSEKGPGPFDGEQAMLELHRLLEAAEVETPVVFVGHSLGTLLGQVFHERYPEDIAGLVFVDWRPPEALIEDFEAERGAEIEGCSWKCHLLAAAARVGLVRLMLERTEFLQDERLPAEAVEEFKALSSLPGNLVAALEVAKYVPSYLFDAQDAGDLGELPLLVLYSSEMGSLFGVFDSEEERRTWFAEELPAEQQMAIRLSSRSRGPIAVEGSNHVSVIAYQEYGAQVAEEIIRWLGDVGILAEDEHSSDPLSAETPP